MCLGLIYWPGQDPEPVVQENPKPREKPSKVKRFLGLNSGYRKNPDIGPDPTRSLSLYRSYAFRRYSFDFQKLD